MRKILYSSTLKFVAVILFTVSTVIGSVAAINGVIKYSEEEFDLYNFETDFSDSWYFYRLLDTAEHTLSAAYYNSFDLFSTSDGLTVIGDSEEMEKRLTDAFDDCVDSDKVNYYVKWNDLVLTNCGAESAEELMSTEYHSYVMRDSDGDIERAGFARSNVHYANTLDEIERFDKTSTIVIGCSIKEECINEYKAIWEKQEDIVIDAIVQTLVCALTALVLLIYLASVCGKSKDGEFKNMWIDNVWLEVHLAAVAGAFVGAVSLCYYILNEYIHGYFPQKLFYPIFIITAALGCLVIITSLLSAIRNIKNGRLMKTSITVSILVFVIRLTFKGLKRILMAVSSFWKSVFRLLSKRSGLLFTCMLLVYTVLIFVVGTGTAFSPVWLAVGILLFVFACFVLANRGNDLDEIKKGVRNVRDGNVSYKIPELKCDDMKALSSSINELAKGLDESVAAKIKAERMKSELITNVSHDLKTPITSIISYTELLSKVDGLPEEAMDYVSVIAKKSVGLKNLTQDLFDISKVQSGNDDVIFEKLDVALLISQAIGENDKEIQSSGLPFCVTAPKELYISADGRKMSRVLGNLINNILKYALKNTRVFVTAFEKDGTVQMEFKNISAYPLNFSVEDITQRFVRGDESRTAEGNGLGLAIAKSYTEVCGGIFEVVIDGDMFKAILKFPKQD